jgi:hypothetical protein
MAFVNRCCKDPRHGREVDMRRLVGAIVVGMALAGAVAAQGLTSQPTADISHPSKRRGCNVATLRGAYGIQVQGTRPTGPGGPTEPVIGVVHRIYDGAGQFTQSDNIKGLITGFTPDRPGYGTYEVNEDCTAVAHFQPGPGISLEERLVLVAGGDEVFSIVTSPAPVMMSGRQVRVSSR